MRAASALLARIRRAETDRIYWTVIDPRLAGKPVGAPPELTVMVCTACVDVPFMLLVVLPHPTSVAARISAIASTTRWRRRNLPVIASIPKAMAASIKLDILDCLNGDGHVNPA